MEGKNNLMRKHSKSLYSVSRNFQREFRSINIRLSDGIPIIETEEETNNKLSTKQFNKGKSEYDLFQGDYHNHYQTSLSNSNRDLIQEGSSEKLNTQKENNIRDMKKDDNKTVDNKILFEKLELINTFNKKLTAQENQTQTEALFTKIQTDEIVCGIMTIISILSSNVYNSINYQTDPTNNNMRIMALNLSLIIVSISNIIFSKF